MSSSIKSNYSVYKGGIQNPALRREKIATNRTFARLFAGTATTARMICAKMESALLEV
ncbi:MAG: hypothetical protein HC902_12650 [Calothrix sp. SM1_5_4]|nr:hypothetical protein [Calothrix sp. SM1_5_4]